MLPPRIDDLVSSIDARIVDLDPEGDLGAFLAPVIAGARARGVADGLEMIGIGAVLIDGTGRVMHVGGRARRMLGGYARIAGDHLLGQCGSDNAAIQALIGSAVGAGGHDPQDRVTLGRGVGAGLTIRAVRFEDEAGEAQLLRAVVILEEDRST